MHTLILGMTESGKTTTAKVLISVFKRRGIKSIVLDPFNDPGFGADYQTNNSDDFLKMVWSSRKCHVYVDESGKAIGRYNQLMDELATTGRHWGHSCFFITQKATQISPIIRDQCGQVFLFGSGHQSCKMIAEEFNDKEFLNATALKQGEFYHKTRFGKLHKGNIFQISDANKKGITPIDLS